MPGVIQKRPPGAFLAAKVGIGAVFLTLLWPPEAAAAARSQPLDPALCQQAGRWLDPKSGAVLDPKLLLADLAAPGVVLLGESHASLEDHRWQAQVLAGLHAHHPDIVIGFEMFPRAAQTALDEWGQGKLSEAALLSRSRWDEVWGYDPDFYLPLLDLARQNRLPIVALNVDRSLIGKVGRSGWAQVPLPEREGIGTPAPASDAYRGVLAEVFAAKLTHGVKQIELPADSAPDIEEILAREDFGRFVEAQLTWDRAMAEALAAARKMHPESLVVGLLGRGHAAQFHGVPHQLADIGIGRTAVLLPVTTGGACEAMPTDLADAVFLVDPREDIGGAPPKPRLGIMLETVADGVQITRIVGGSVAEAAQLAAGDLIIEAAGLTVRQGADLVEIIERQAPGTWLPLGILRDGEEMEVIAKFPPLEERSQ